VFRNNFSFSSFCELKGVVSSYLHSKPSAMDILQRNNFMVKTALCLLSLSAITGCYKTPLPGPAPQAVFASYELQYDQNFNTTSANVVFYSGSAKGVYVLLNSLASVTFNGTAIPYNASLHAYQITMNGLVSVGTFVYRDEQNKVYTNTISGIKPQSFLPSLDSIRKSVPYSLGWVGDTLRQNETINVTMTPSVPTGVYSLWTNTLSGSTSMILDPVKLSAIGVTGPATIQMERFLQTNAAQVTAAGGTIRSRYNSMQRNVQLY
jgi:hypothetical protein